MGSFCLLLLALAASLISPGLSGASATKTRAQGITSWVTVYSSLLTVLRAIFCCSTSIDHCASKKYRLLMDINEFDFVLINGHWLELMVFIITKSFIIIIIIIYYANFIFSNVFSFLYIIEYLWSFHSKSLKMSPKAILSCVFHYFLSFHRLNKKKKKNFMKILICCRPISLF